jgi:hypothetical protein
MLEEERVNKVEEKKKVIIYRECLGILMDKEEKGLCSFNERGLH